MKMKFIKTLALIAGFAAFAAIAAGEGDIYEIRPCLESGTTITPSWSQDNPVPAGQMIYFKVRFARDDAMEGVGANWIYKYIGYSSEAIENITNPLKIGIYVSGQLRFAEHITDYDSGDGILDVVFGYKVQAGDFALPIRLASSANTPVAYGNTAPEYLTLNANKFNVVSSASDAKRATYAYITDYGARSKSSPGNLDYDLTKAGFYVRTINFDSSWEQSSYWRVVHAGSDITESLTPNLQLESGAGTLTEAVTLHVWSLNDDIVRIKGGTTREITVGYDGATPITKTTSVGDITFSTGQTSVNFSIEGTGAVGEESSLVLSAWTDFNYDVGYTSRPRVIDFITVPVAVSEALPPTLIVESSPTSVIYAGSDYLTRAAQLSVYLSQPYSSDMVVTLSPTFEDSSVSSGDWGNYIRFSTLSSVAGLPDATLPTVTIPAGSTDKQTLFVYTLRGDDHTTNYQVKLNPSVDAAADAFLTGGKNPAAFYIYPTAPNITYPTDSFTLNTTSQEDKNLTIRLDDTYADTHDSATGYEIRVKYTADSDWTTLSGKYFLNAGELKAKDSEGKWKYPVLNYPANAKGTQTTELYVVSPVSGKESGHVAFTAVVASPRTIALETTDGTDGEYNESDSDYVNFKITLSADNDKTDTIYAFLKPDSEVEDSVADIFGAVGSQRCIIGMKNAKGIPIEVGMGGPTSPVKGRFKALQGVEGGLNVTFTVVLSYDENYDPDDPNLVGGYSSDSMQLSINNVKPSISNVMVNGFDMADYEDEGRVFPNELPCGVDHTFLPEIDDVNYDIKSNMLYRYTIKYDNKSVKTAIVTNSTDGVQAFTYKFSKEGLWSIKIDVMDWDMASNNAQWSKAPSYTFYVKTIKDPVVGISVDDIYSEASTRSYIHVSLPIHESFDPLVVQLVVTPASGTNPGILKLDDAYHSLPEGYSADDGYDLDVGDNIYYIPFDGAGTEDILIEEMDGTYLSSTKGFSLSASVVTKDTYEAVGKSWCDYYQTGLRKVYVENAAPTFTATTTEENDESNRWVVAGRATNRPIRWGFKGDVEGDFTTEWPEEEGKKGIKVSFDGCVNATNIFVELDDVYSGTFVPDFGSAQGKQDVIVTIEDKDGGQDTRTYRYEIAAAKILRTVANGPTRTTSLPLSTKYRGMTGSGEGHVFVEDMKATSSSKFNIKWNCGTANTVDAYAFGYKNGVPDDGNLDNKYDVALGTTGSLAEAEPYYTYTDPHGYDSFFYGWILAGEPGGTDYSISVSPQIGEPDSAIIHLPTEKTGDDTGYLETYAEAVFSREYMSEDNLGDIDHDGIPDVFAMKIYANGSALATADGQGSELGAKNSQNDDEDFLPSTSQLGSSTLVPGAISGWPNNGQPFNAFLEIRGLGDGLNYGMFRPDQQEFETHSKIGWVSELELTDNEKCALLRYVFERRDAIRDKREAGKDLTISTMWNEYTEEALIKDFIGTLFYTGCSKFSNGDKMFLSENMVEITKHFQLLNEDDVAALTNYNVLAIAPDALNEHYKFVEETNVVDDVEVAVTNLVYIREFWGEGVLDSDVGNHTFVTNYLGLTYSTNIVGGVTNVYVTLRKPAWDATFADVNVGDFLGDDSPAEQQTTAKAYIDYTWQNYARYGIWGWTCENRTNPLIDDTDGDGVPDGYEYFIWYDAVIGTHGTNRLVGCKFVLDDPESYDDIITSEDIAEIYNPNLKRTWTRVDTDNDALYDIEERLIGTSPVHWDTDRDGLSDFYELVYNSNPLAANGGNNGAANLDGDFMARAEYPVENWVYMAKNGAYYAVTNYVDFAEAGEDGVVHVDLTGFEVAPFAYSGTTTNYIPKTENTAPSNIYTRVRFDVADTTAIATNKVFLYHHQVHNYFGFDPRTGWGSAPNGSLSTTSRWMSNGSVLEGGKPVNTAAFTAKDEFILMKYRYIVGLNDVKKDLQDVKDGKLTYQALIIARSTNPNVPFESTTYNGDSEMTFKQDKHGADTDGDGVPDGWELYIGVNPNIAFTIPRGPGYDALYWDGNGIWPGIAENADYDDGLTLVGEFAGADTCGMYNDNATYNGFPVCSSIYANHPSQAGSIHKGWFNKLFPTDPRNSDTDGDGVSDGAEGETWGGTFTINRWGSGNHTGKTVKYYSIYGSTTNTSSRCTKGGGYNPCTIDTDADGLPDPWERQYSGILFKDDVVAMEEPYTVFPTGVPDAEFYDDIRAALAAYSYYVSTNEEEEVSGYYHVMMGMDGTVPDAYTSTVIGASDRDWDGDGLQNWQEYMVQAMRHFRYDDDKTPLMGYDCPVVDIIENTITKGEWCAGAVDGTNRFLKVSYMEPFTSLQLSYLRDELGYTNFVEYALANPNYLSDLGYFADPPMAWDHARIDLQNKYMLPPKVTSYMVMTEPVETYDMENCETWEDLFGIKHEIFSYIGGDHGFTNDVSGTISARYINGRTQYTGFVDGMAVILTPCAPLVVKDETYIAKSTALRKNYFGTDPRLWDTDNDGMDDYYELFHGLNPILGDIGSLDTYEYGKDVIRDSVYRVSPWQNAWVGWENESEPQYDPIRYPWMMGAGQCDADGDGLRNDEESLLANVTTPSNTHTDPTPLWMTDNSVVKYTLPVPYTSYSIAMTWKDPDDPLSTEMVPVYTSDDGGATWYVLTNRVDSAEELEFVASPSYTALFYDNELLSSRIETSEEDDSGTTITVTSSSNLTSERAFNCYGYTYLASFEENEGYDTDNDWRSDAGEMKPTAEPKSDPLHFGDPLRRQSIWFGGPDEKGLAISATPTRRTTTGVDLFRQFTVEVWVRPENATADEDKYIVSRAANYGGWDLINSNAVVRMNFAIGIDKNGRAFAEMQNSTETTCRIEGSEVADGEWVHLAATFDGTMLRIYVNGRQSAELETKIIPANGVSMIQQDPQFTGGFPYSNSGYATLPSATVIGGRPCGSGAFSMSIAAEEGWDSVATDFFKGSVSEVRIWDGARLASDIASNYKTRFTADTAKDLRLETFYSYIGGARRNDMSSDSILPAELIQHYDFGTLAGAVTNKYVQQVPAGFETNVIAMVRNADGTLMSDAIRVGWWKPILDSEVGSAVYTSGHVVPWIENTVAHLPKLCGSVADSVYWSEYYAGYTPASYQDLSKYSFPNEMNPYGLVENNYEEFYLRAKLSKVSNVTNEVASDEALMTRDSVLARYFFELRRDFTGSNDLVPLGSAYAKRLGASEGGSWDGLGAEDAWSITTDGTGALDGDPADSGIPAWYNGTLDAYRRALAKGLVPKDANGGEPLDDYIDRVDLDKDGLPDWWTDLYNVKGGALDDDDNDGLSNFNEYLLAEIFKLKKDDKSFSPVNAYSMSAFDTDYFFKVGQIYAGEIFTDHDFMEDSWESAQPTTYVKSDVWDANSDNDSDGWTAFAERRYSQFTSAIEASKISHVVGGEEVKDMPIPTLKLALHYNGNKDLKASSQSSSSSSSSSSATVADENALAPLVIQTWSDDSKAQPDATFKIQPGQTTTYTSYIGRWSDRTFRGTLTPGYINSTTFELETAQYSESENYLVYVTDVPGREDGYYNMTYEQYLSAISTYGRTKIALQSKESFVWTGFTDASVVNITTSADGSTSYICIRGERIGTINTQTGEYEVNFGSLNRAYVYNTNGANRVASSLLRFKYEATIPVLANNKLEVSLGTPTSGYVREGTNRIVAFYDLDGNGKYTVGEPMGQVDGVDVGWFQSKVALEIKDYSPVTTRLNLFESDESDDYRTIDGAIDNWGTVSDDGPKNTVEEAKSAFNVSSRAWVDAKVVRYAVDGRPVYNVGLQGVPARVVLSDRFYSGTKETITEKDFISVEDGLFDIDWANLRTDAANYRSNYSGPLTNVTYAVVFGDSPTGFRSQSDDTVVVTAMTHVITRRFDLNRLKPTIVEPGDASVAVFAARPTFKWTMGGNDTYTAFKVKVFNGTKEVWDSGLKVAPAVDKDGVYTFEPDLYANDVLETDVNYTWRVAMYNAKFSSDESTGWSVASKSFRMASLTNRPNYGSIRVCAKYFGPSTVLSSGTIRVEAFTTPDFTGTPVARTYVSDTSDVGTIDIKHAANVVIGGLPKGTYYVRGYIDIPTNIVKTAGKAYVRDNWESWGYVCNRDGSSEDIFAPRAVVIGDEFGEGDLFDLYIEDVDTNQNLLPDAWEMVKNKGKFESVANINDVGGVYISPSLEVVLESEGEAIQGLAARTFMVMQSTGIATLGSGYDDYSDLAGSMDLSSDGEATNVVVTAIAAADGKVTISAKVSGEEAAGAGASGKATRTSATSTLRRYYTTGNAAESKSQTALVLYKFDLSETEWRGRGEADIKVTTPVDISSGEAVITDLDISAIRNAATAAGFDRCFFKIVVEEE